MNPNEKRDAAAANEYWDTSYSKAFCKGWDARDAEVSELRSQFERHKELLRVQCNHSQDLQAKIDSLKQQVEKLKAFIIKWLEFEESCIKKDGPYVSLPIPKLMDEANKLLGWEG